MGTTDKRLTNNKIGRLITKNLVIIIYPNIVKTISFNIA